MQRNAAGTAATISAIRVVEFTLNRPGQTFHFEDSRNIAQRDRAKNGFLASRNVRKSCPQTEHSQASFGSMPFCTCTAVDR